MSTAKAVGDESCDLSPVCGPPDLSHLGLPTESHRVTLKDAYTLPYIISCHVSLVSGWLRVMMTTPMTKMIISVEKLFIKYSHIQF